MPSASRYDAIVATFVGVLALGVSGYTAYVQRQQVRAQVYPIVQFLSGANDQDFHVILENKGMGPALIRDVKLTMDGKPMHDWGDVIEDVLGPGKPSLRYNSFGQYVLAPGESFHVLNFFGLQPLEPKPGSPALTVETPQKSRRRLSEARQRMRVSICYCSTLGDCWTLRLSVDEHDTKETRRCAEPTGDSFN